MSDNALGNLVGIAALVSLGSLLLMIIREVYRTYPEILAWALSLDPLFVLFCLSGAVMTTGLSIGINRK